MQKFIFTIALLFSLNASVSAATNFSLFFNDTRGLEETRKLASAIRINEMTFIQVKRLNDTKYKELDQAAVKFNTNPEAKAASIKEIETNYAAKISALLNTAENAAFTEYLKTTTSFIAGSK